MLLSLLDDEDADEADDDDSVSRYRTGARRSRCPNA